MKLKIVAPVLAALLYIPAFLFTVATESKELTPFQPTPVPKYALLVGVNEYKKQPGGISGLGGTHNDVALMKTLLAEKGFKEDGSAATKAFLLLGLMAGSWQSRHRSNLDRARLDLRQHL